MLIEFLYKNQDFICVAAPTNWCRQIGNTQFKVGTNTRIDLVSENFLL